MADHFHMKEKIECLETELHEAVRVAYNRGAKEWTRLNYPKLFKMFEKERREGVI
jgi:hypothetical protein